MTSKQCYHPALLVPFYLDFLPTAVRQHIPRSTLHDWKHKEIETYFGKEWFLENSQLFATLQQVATNNRLL